MPMHYPPLADGTYRYGDEPRPLPSPEPGPDTVSPNAPPPTVAGLPGDAPPPAAPAGSSRPRGTVAAVAIVGGLALVVVAVVGMALFGPGADRSGPADTIRGPFPGSGPAQAPIPGPGEFTVDGTFTVVSTPADPVSGDRAGCDMPDSLSDIGEGTPLTLVEDHTGREIDARLAYDGGDLSSCMFTFQFPDVTPDGTLYLIELPGRGQLVYTEDELRAGVDISLGR